MSSIAKILIAEDIRLVSEGIAALLEKEQNLTVVGQVPNGHECLRFLQENPVDLLLLDHKMPQLNGLNTLKQIREQGFELKVILLTLLTEEGLVREYQQIGIDGCLVKQDSPEEFVFGVKQVLRGESFYSSAITSLVLGQGERYAQMPAEHQENLNTLTRSEREILSLIAQGMSVLEMSELRHRSVQTINKQKQSIMNKLQIHKETKLMKFALDFGIN